jgi:hypothetical protein
MNTHPQETPFHGEGPQPLMRDIPPGAPYPVAALGPQRVARECLESGYSECAPPAVPMSETPSPPMTGAERDAFRLAVHGCWNVDPGSEAARVTVTVQFELDQLGRVLGDIRMVSNTGGSDVAIRSAFDSARRAVLRCQGPGYTLPADKHAQWRLVELTFNPEQMRIR